MASATYSITTDKILKSVKDSKDYIHANYYRAAVLDLVKTVLDHGGPNWKINVPPGQFKWPNKGTRKVKGQFQNKQIVLKSDSETLNWT